MLKRVACFSASPKKKKTKKKTVACFLDNLALECGQPPHSLLLGQRATHIEV